MYPEQYVLLQAVPAAEREAALAEKASAALADSLPGKSPAEIVEDLLARLNRKRASRDLRGVNHWEAFCPGYLEKLVRRMRTGAPLRQIVRFFVLNHSSAVEFANRITCDRYLAETVVSQTYIELLQGRTTIALFYHALKMNARDALRLQQIERGRFESLDHMVAEDSSRKSAGYDSLGESERADFQSHRWDDQDPIDVLIQREDRAELDQMVQTALKDPRWRYIKRLKWASPLAACAKKAGSFE